MLYDIALSAFKAIYSISFLKKLFNLVFFIWYNFVENFEILCSSISAKDFNGRYI